MSPEPFESAAPGEADGSAGPRPGLSRGRALAEVLLCSGYPTQILLVAVLASVGILPTVDGRLSPAFVFILSGLDTILLLGLVFWFIRRAGERPGEIFLGPRPPAGEVRLGVLLVPALLILVVVVQLAVRAVAPALHNVETNPFSVLFGSPGLVAAFLALVLVAGGLREELQRAFLLHRFEQRLGGARPGIALTSIAFGLGHSLQGWDAAIVTGVMGAVWAATYVSRRGVVANVTSHALFNVAQVLLGSMAIARG